MSVYLRPKVTGATVFFTVALAQRGSDLLVREIAALRAAVRTTMADRPFSIDAWVVVPDHIHAVWTLPAGDRAYGLRWGAIKARFLRALGAREVAESDRRPAQSRPGFSPAHPAIPTELPMVRAGRYAGRTSARQRSGSGGSGNTTSGTRRTMQTTCGIAGWIR